VRVVRHRIHVGTRETYARSGGLHSYVLGLSAGQAALGLRTTVLGAIGRDGSSEAHGPAAWDGDPLDDDDIVHFHLAHGARPFLRHRGRQIEASRRAFLFHGPWYAEGLAGGDSLPRPRRSASTRRPPIDGSPLRDCVHVFADILHRRFGVAPDRITTVHPGVDVGRFTPGDAQDARLQLG
jgi:hypothetical protein